MGREVPLLQPLSASRVIHVLGRHLYEVADAVIEAQLLAPGPLPKKRFRCIAKQRLLEALARSNKMTNPNGPEPRRVTVSQGGVPLEISD